MVDYRKYKVWQKSHQLVLDVYAITSNFPKEEQFNLVSQINRAAVSIPTNIAEGCGRETQKELMTRLEKEGMNKMQQLNAKIDRGELPPFGKEHMDQVMQVMKDGEKEFVENTGRNMTYAEMRAMYG